jgi:tetratricopeptide (TPR) repeat protein
MNKIIFLPVPESFKEKLRNLPVAHIEHAHDDEHDEHEHHHHDILEGFTINSEIPIPVEIDDTENNGSPSEGLLMEKLSWEMIISAMMKVIRGPAQDDWPQITNDWMNYYRAFVMQVRPDIRTELSNAAIIKAKNGQYDMALDIISLIDGLSPGSPEMLLDRALILEGKADTLSREGHLEAQDKVWQEAREAYEALLAMDDRPMEASLNAGLFFMDAKDYAQARECLEDYLDACPVDVEGPAAETRAKAQALLKEITDRGLDDADFLQAVDLVQDGKFGEAMLRVKDFIQKHPQVWNGWFVLGWALREMGRWEDGHAAFRKALEFAEHDKSGAANLPDIQNEIAICLMELGQLDKAKESLLHALDVDNDNIKIISNLGIVAQKQGFDDEAAGWFRTVLDIDPDDPVAKAYFQQ